MSKERHDYTEQDVDEMILRQSRYSELIAEGLHEEARKVWDETDNYFLSQGLSKEEVFKLGVASTRRHTAFMKKINQGVEAFAEGIDV